jgi:hypothetical protein
LKGKVSFKGIGRFISGSFFESVLRTVNTLLAEELQVIHALSIVAKTPSQWEENSVVAKSPPCLGGEGKKSRPSSPLPEGEERL